MIENNAYLCKSMFGKTLNQLDIQHQEYKN